ncbi:MAG: NADPH:quinone oxidoreductase family protein [Candidatus Dormibacteraeota bacterium]|nr:NADPH:quinone oxidoreductase family protein [Candidatus Dormibacteraeota bacterium]
MRAQQISELTGPGALKLVELSDPDPGGGVLIDVVSAGVSFPDLLMSRGLYQTKPPRPFVPGVEVAGTVLSSTSPEFEPGDPVMAVTMIGGFAEVAVAPPELTVPIPLGLSMDAAGGFILNYHTAYFALARRARLGEGQTLLVHGAAGGVGTAAIQVGRGLGARVFGVASSAAKREVAIAAGAEDAVDSSADWNAWIRDRTDGRGADVIFDPVGGDRFDASLRALAPEGRLVVIGFTEGRIPTLQVNRLLFRNVEVVGAAWGAFLAAEPQFFATAEAELEPMIQQGAVAPVIGATLPLERAADALRMLENREATGKIVLAI